MSTSDQSLLQQIASDLSAIRVLLEAQTPSSAARPDGALVTSSELASLLGVSPRELRRLRASGEVPTPLRGPGRPRWTRKVIDAWLEKRR